MKSDITRQINTLTGKNSGTLAGHDPLYPRSVKDAIRKPPTLYFRGNISLLENPALLSVVGSRMLSASNQASLLCILKPLKQVNVTIVSGLARGLDALAHTIALENNLPTIAVLGSSVEHNEIYPSSNTNLAERIVDADGLLISPFPPHTPVMPYNFPARNQIIAALSHAVLVGSAAKKSGALITAHHALDYGKDVMVIPGAIGDPLFEGSNLLLQSGAAPVLSSRDILSYFNLDQSADNGYVSSDPDEQKILSALQHQRLTPNELSNQLELPPGTINRIITAFELNGWIVITADGKIQLV